MSKPDRQAAFTVAELIVAIALFALAATALTQTVVNVVRNLEGLIDEGRVERDLSFLRRYVLLAPDRETAEQGGDAQTLNYGVGSWEVLVEETEVVDLFRATLSFELAGSDTTANGVLLEENLWLLRPHWSLEEDRAALLEEKREGLLDRRSSVEWLGRELEQ